MRFTLDGIARSGLVLLAVAIGCGAFGGAPQPRRWSEVRPGWLFRSAQIPRGDVAVVLRERGIDTVIDLSDEPSDRAREAEASAARALGIRYLHFPVSPGARRQVDAFARAVAEIERAHDRGERVLVHCKLGHRRSASAVALYARLVEHQPPALAYRELFRFADARAAWQADARDFLERHLPEIETRVRAARSASPAA